MRYVCDIRLKWVLYVIATDPGTITMIQRVGFTFRKPGLFHHPRRSNPKPACEGYLCERPEHRSCHIRCPSATLSKAVEQAPWRQPLEGSKLQIDLTSNTSAQERCSKPVDLIQASANIVSLQVVTFARQQHAKRKNSSA